jgi:translation elongation factor P/translation initiation factor 5A
MNTVFKAPNSLNLLTNMAVLDFSDLKGTGQIIKYNNEPYQIIWSNFMRTAQRKPVIQAKLAQPHDRQSHGVLV